MGGVQALLATRPHAEFTTPLYAASCKHSIPATLTLFRCILGPSPAPHILHNLKPLPQLLQTLAEDEAGPCSKQGAAASLAQAGAHAGWCMGLGQSSLHFQAAVSTLFQYGPIKRKTIFRVGYVYILCSFCCSWVAENSCKSMTFQWNFLENSKQVGVYFYKQGLDFSNPPVIHWFSN